MEKQQAVVLDLERQLSQENEACQATQAKIITHATQAKIIAHAESAIGMEHILSRIQKVDFMKFREYRVALGSAPPRGLTDNPNFAVIHFDTFQISLQLCLHTKGCRMEISNETERVWLPFYCDLNETGYTLCANVLGVKSFNYTTHLMFLGLIKSYLIHYIRKSKVFDEPEFVRFWAA